MDSTQSISPKLTESFYWYGKERKVLSIALSSASGAALYWIGKSAVQLSFLAKVHPLQSAAFAFIAKTVSVFSLFYISEYITNGVYSSRLVADLLGDGVAAAISYGAFHYGFIALPIALSTLAILSIITIALSFIINIDGHIGSIEYSNGLKYMGPLVDGKRQGIGQLWRGSDLVFQGMFKNDELDGAGKVFSSDKSILYDGEFSAGKSQLFTLNQGDIEQKITIISSHLDTRVRKRHIPPKVEGEAPKDPVLLFEGDLKNGNPSGHCFLQYPENDSENRDYYNGNFDKGIEVGEGKLVYKNGTIYAGEFLAGKPHGKGKVTFKNKAYYEGQFEKGKMCGLGSYKTEREWIIEAIWKEGAYETIIRAKNKLGVTYEPIPGVSLLEFYIQLKMESIDTLSVKVPTVGRAKMIKANGDSYEGVFTYTSGDKPKVSFSGKKTQHVENEEVK